MQPLRKANALRKTQGTVTLIRRGAKYITRRGLGHLYRLGSARECPLCNSTFHRFQTAGFPGRPDAECQTCGVRERHRVFWLYLRNETDILDRGRELLYIAPSPQIEAALRQYTSVTTLDLNRGDVDCRASITAMPFDDDAFDAVICNHVLEHVPDDRAAIAELERVVAPDGEALVMVPKDKGSDETFEDPSITTLSERVEAFGQYDHVRMYGRDFSDRLAAGSFDVTTEAYAETLDEDTVTRFGLQAIESQERVKHHDIHHCVVSE